MEKMVLCTIPEEVRDTIEAHHYQKAATADLINYLVSNTAYGDNTEYIDKLRQEYQEHFAKFSLVFNEAVQQFAPGAPVDSVQLDFASAEMFVWTKS